MTDEATHIHARRRLRRRVAFWRLTAILVLAVSAAVWLWRIQPAGSHVARHEVTGIILEDPARNDLLRGLAHDDEVAALILRVDSPGGTVPGAEGLFAAVREVAARKPVVAVLGEVAASGGYIAALATDHIVARGGTLTGSIGVVAHYPNAAELLERVGIDVARVASTPLKAEPSPFREPSPEALEAQEAIVSDSYLWFLGLVAERRGLEAERARELGDGRVYTGRQAFALGLIDRVGGEPEARDWLERARGVPGSLPVREAAVDQGPIGLVDLLNSAAAAAALEGLFAPRLLAILR